jgi:DNA-binding NarL/FixJ family response regulator
MKTIRVVFAEDHALVRAGIRSLLKNMDQIEVLAEVSDGREAVEAVALHHPDVVLMDITMKGLNGIDATSRICKDHPKTHVLILSAHTAKEYVLQALRAGASGYLLKDAQPKELKEAIETVARGETYLTQAISKHVIADYLRQFEMPFASEPLDQLTPRQREILQLVAEGNTTKQIAGLLNISVKTVETHRHQVMETLGVSDVTGLVRFAIRMGLVSAEE